VFEELIDFGERPSRRVRRHRLEGRFDLADRAHVREEL
jgi:hypothetical protein